MRKALLVLATVSLAACANDHGSRTAGVAAQRANAAPSDPISPAAAAGIYMDKDEVAAYRSTRQISADACDAATERQAPAAGMLLLHGDGGVYVYDPGIATRPEDKIMQFQNGKLETPPTGGSTTQMEPSLFRTAQGVRFHMHATDLRTKKATDSDQEMAKITEQEARDIRNQESQCAAKQITGVLSDLPAGSGLASVTDASGTARGIQMSPENGNPVSCNLSEDGKRIEIEALRPRKTPGVYIVDGIAFTFPMVNPSVRNFPIDVMLGRDINNYELLLNDGSQPGFSYAGDCVTRVKKNSYLIEAEISCPKVDRVETATQKHDVVSLKANLTCDRMKVSK
jgi:hypothetical protein